MKDIKFIVDDNCFVFECPHCSCYIQVEANQVNCQIFRHGVYKSTGIQINPHASKIECEQLVSQNLILGCGKPFRFIMKDDKWSCVDVCDYI